MRTTIDKAGRIVVPKSLRDELGLDPGTELDVEAVDGRIEISVPSRIEVVEGHRGPIFHVPGAEPLSTDQVRDLIERSRR